MARARQAAKREPTAKATREPDGDSEANDAAAPSRFRSINGIRVPIGTRRYLVFRYADPSGKGPKTRCSILDKTERRHEFNFEKEVPSWDEVLRLWGSGTYRFQWWADPQRPGDSGTRGFSIARTFEDASRPALPDYNRTPTLGSPAPAEPPPPRSPVDDPMVNLLRMHAGGDGKLDIGVVLVFMGVTQQWQEKQRNEQEAQYRRWAEEDRRRASERDSEHARRLEREREMAAQERERTAEFFQRQAQAAPAPDGGRLEELAESVAELASEVGRGSSRTNATLDKAIEVMLPLAAQRFFGAAPPSAPPKVGP